MKNNFEPSLRVIAWKCGTSCVPATDTRWWVDRFTLRPHFSKEQNPAPIVQDSELYPEWGWAQGKRRGRYEEKHLVNPAIGLACYDHIAVITIVIIIIITTSITTIIIKSIYFIIGGKSYWKTPRQLSTVTLFMRAIKKEEFTWTWSHTSKCITF